MDENETWHVYAELEAQLCRANARAEAAEQHAKELDYKLGLALHDSEQGIADANESEACLKAENAALREKLAVATQGLQRIKAKTTNVMAMVWSEETLKKLGVE